MAANRWTDSQVRVYTLLIRLSREQGNDLVTLSRPQVAEMAGLTEVTARKAMDRLESKGLVETMPRQDNRAPNVFRLVDADGLSVGL